jgi:cation-transporting ATPase E
VIAAADSRPNASLRALGAWACEQECAEVDGRPLVPFSSGRRWSAAVGGERGGNERTWLLGAPDVLLPSALAPTAAAKVRVAALTSEGRRVLVLAEAIADIDENAPLGSVLPAAIVALEEHIRPDAADTVKYFLRQGVALKVLSGDDPATVGAVARAVGIPGSGRPVDARHLPENVADFDRAVEARAVFGRVDPHRKRAIIASLRRGGHVVAMTGDGVNDALALKEADLGIAMASGSAATRGVAQVVLMDSSWSPLPSVVAEGRRVIANVERVGNLFLTKTVYAFLLAISIGVARFPFPFLPRQLTIVSSLTIGIPAFFLALAPNETRAVRGFAVRVLRFAIPAGLIAASATFSGYALARDEPGLSLAEARTTATVVLFLVAFWVVSILARPIVGWRAALLGILATAFALILILPTARDFFALDLPRAVVVLAAIGVASIASSLLESGWRATGWATRHRNRSR